MRIISMMALCVLFIAGVSCKKDHSNDPETPVADPKDSVVAKSFNPGITLTSMNGKTSTGNYANGQFTIHLPVDTLCADSIRAQDFPDFTFSLEAENHKEDAQTPSSVPESYKHAMNLKCTGTYNYVLRASNDPNPLYLNENEVVDPERSNIVWGNYLTLQTQSGPLSVELPTGVKYLGIKSVRGGRVYYGWIKLEFFGKNGVTVKGIALNKSNGRTIRCGQVN